MNSDIIYPEIPRAKHCGYQGYLINGPVQQDWFRDHMLSMTTEYEISSSEIEGCV